MTGGAGFLGAYLSRALADAPENSLTLVDNFVRGRRDADLDALLARPNVRLIEGDLTNPALYQELGQGYDEVYHLAAIIGVRQVLERPDAVLRVNALSTIYLLDWLVAGGGSKIVFSSTSEAYGWTSRWQPLPVPTPEDVPLALTELDNARSSYAGSKIHGELLVTQCCQMAGKAFTIVRYHNVYGPRMGYDHVIPELYTRARGGQRPLIVYSPTHQRAFCYVSDAVDATIAAMRTRAADGLTINIGNDTEEVQIAELARMLLQTAGIEAELHSADAANDPIVRRCPDITRARNLLGYVPRVSLAEGLERTLAWYGRHQAPAATKVSQVLPPSVTAPLAGAGSGR